MDGVLIMRRDYRLNIQCSVVLPTLVVLLLAVALAPTQAVPLFELAAAQQTCDVPGTPFFTEYYGTVTIDGSPAPAGTTVEAYSPRGDRAGCVEVTTAGYYPYMRVYREDPDANPPIPGMQSGDEVMFKVNGVVAQSDPSPITWTDDFGQHPVNLTATSAPCYDLDGSGIVDPADFAEMTWRATDAPSLALYDFNENDVVDVGDYMTLSTHFGESSCAPQ